MRGGQLWLALALAAVVVVVALAGCGATTSSSAHLATPMPSAFPTVTPMPSPTSTPTGGNCQQNLPANTVIADGLAFIKTTNLGNLAYPSAKLPDNLPAQPYQMGQGSTP